jgi:hypothetical protein
MAIVGVQRLKQLSHHAGAEQEAYGVPRCLRQDEKLTAPGADVLC